MIILRPANPDDTAAFYSISLATGHRGGDAGRLYDDPEMIGHIYAAPYLKLEPRLCLVAEDDDGVGGFVCGTEDTYHFEDRLETEWWPDLRKQYPDPGAAPDTGWSADQRRRYMIHHPARTPAEISSAFPAHLHLNLLPRLQRRGVGTRLLAAAIRKLREAGVSAVHVGVNLENRGGRVFWEKSGFVPIPVGSGSETIRTRWLGRSLA